MEACKGTFDQSGSKAVGVCNIDQAPCEERETMKTFDKNQK